MRVGGFLSSPSTAPTQLSAGYNLQPPSPLAAGVFLCLLCLMLSLSRSRSRSVCGVRSCFLLSSLAPICLLPLFPSSIRVSCLVSLRARTTRVAVGSYMHQLTSLALRINAVPRPRFFLFCACCLVVDRVPMAAAGGGPPAAAAAGHVSSSSSLRWSRSCSDTMSPSMTARKDASLTAALLSLPAASESWIVTRSLEPFNQTLFAMDRRGRQRGREAD